MNRKEVLSWIKSILIALVIFFIIRQFIFVPSVVEGESMMPNLQNGNRIIVSRLGDIHHFDKIVFHAPDANENYVKRVIGLPGDKVEMKNDILYINGKAYTEPYLKKNREKIAPMQKLTGDFTLKELTGKTTVPKGDLFVLGDNRLISNDSRYFGFVPMKSVIGKVELRFWPLNEVGEPK